MDLIDLKALLNPSLSYQENKPILLDELETIAPIKGEAIKVFEAEIAHLEKKVESLTRKLKHGTPSQHLKHSRTLIRKGEHFVHDMSCRGIIDSAPYPYVCSPQVHTLAPFRGVLECFRQHLKTGYPELYDLHIQTENALKKLETEGEQEDREELFKLLSKLESEMDRLRLKVEFGTPLGGECDICNPAPSP